MPEERAMDAKGLEALIRKGDVDTVLTVFADGLGRLMGKRVVGRYFLDHVTARGNDRQAIFEGGGRLHRPPLRDGEPRPRPCGRTATPGEKCRKVRT